MSEFVLPTGAIVMARRKAEAWVYLGFRVTTVGSRAYGFVRCLTGRQERAYPLHTYFASSPATIRKKFILPTGADIP